MFHPSAERKALMFLQSGRSFILKHPGNSIARRLDEWRTLEGNVVFCSIPLALYVSSLRKKKFKVAYTNILSLRERMERKCTDLYPHTREPHDAFTIDEPKKL